MTLHPFARAPAALAVTVSQIIAALPALADDRVLAENGAHVDVRDRYIATSGHAETAIIARTGGSVSAQNITIATSANDSLGLHVRHAGSLVDSRRGFNVSTSGNGSTGVLVSEQGAAIFDTLDIRTTGASARGVNLLSGGSLTLGGGRISTLGAGGHGMMTLGGNASLMAENLSVDTQGNFAFGVHVNNTSSAQLRRLDITTAGEQSRGIYVIGQNAALWADDITVVTRGDNAAGVYGLATEVPLLMNGFDIRSEGRASHGVQIDQAHAHLVRGRIQVSDGYGLWVAGVGASGQASSVRGNQLAIEGGGVFASAARVALQDSSINTTANGAPGLAISRGGQVDLDRVQVRGHGTHSPVMLLDGGRLQAWASDLSAFGGEAINARSGANQVTLDQSTLRGTVRVAEHASLGLSLQNNAGLHGQLENVTRLALRSGSSWDMVASSSVGALHLEDGGIKFGDQAQYYTLTAGELSGNGTFTLSLNAQARQIDFLEITGQARGSHWLHVQNSGTEPGIAFDPLQVIRTGGGDADFVLLGERVDLGAFSYALQKNGDDWFLSGEHAVISPSTRTVQALFNTAPSIWYGELSSLRSRLGEVRGTGQGGIWMRSYGNKYNVDPAGGLHYSQQQLGFSLGLDTAVTTVDSQWLVGMLGGYSHSDLNLSRGSSGQVDSYYAGVYGTWLADSGWYADGMLKLNQFQNRADVSMSDASRATGNYVSHGLGASFELGKHIKLGDELFVEPFTQLSALTVGGRRFSLDNGIQAQNAGTGSLLGKAGGTFGSTHALAVGGIVQPYLKAALAHEFARDNQVKVNGHRFDNDLSGTRGELSAGVAVTMSAQLQLHSHVDYMKGERIEQPWGVNLGLRYAFD